jgi:hypothetical protein
MGEGDRLVWRLNMDEETERIWELVKDWKLEYEVMYTAIAYMKSDPTMSVGEAIADSAMMWIK